jgi:DNA-binding NarL/FixJ family response regulator
MGCASASGWRVYGLARRWRLKQREIMSKKRPRTGWPLAGLSGPAGSKMEPAYWRERLFRSGYTYKGRHLKVRGWSVKIQHLGRRKTFSLPSSRRGPAAAQACQLYRTIVNQGWQQAGVRGGRRSVPAGLAPAEPTPSGAERLGRDFWAQRLIHREYSMSLDMKRAAELSVRVDHQATSHYFPLGTENAKLAASRALRIYQAVASQGWESANERFRRELTVAFRWLDHPLAWTYTTIHTHANIHRRPSADTFNKGTGRLKVAIAESDGAIRRALVWCLNHMDGFCCAAAYASAAEAIRDLPRRSACLVLVSQNLADKPGTACLEELKAAAPGAAGLLFSVYEDSEELFRATPGGAGTYLLRRTPPTGFLEPAAEVLSRGNLSAGELPAGVWQYFKNMVASLPISGPARQLPHLTNREREVLALLGKGRQDKEIAVRLDISIYTVHEHVRNIFEKLRVHNRTEAVVKFLQK